MATDIHRESAAPLDEPVYVESETHLATLVREHDVVLVDFFAEWCGPCQMLDSVVRGLAADTDAVVAKVDIDEHQELAGAYAVRGVPTLLLFADGELVEQQVGAVPADRLRGLIENYTE